MIGRVVKGIGGFYFVSDGKDAIMGKARGNLKRNKDLIYVGDIVKYDIDDNGECVINEVIERNNFLTRPPVSNLEMLVVVFATTNPEPNLPVVDKLIAACEKENIQVVVCISKIDLVSEERLNFFRNIYKDIYPTVCVNGINGDSVDILREMISGKNVALAGPSGVGKSTLTNALLGNEKAKTGDISDKTLRGKHTTRHVEIFELSDGTKLYDTPGFTSLELQNLSDTDVKNLFPEFLKRSSECKYSNCMHINEPDCAIKESLNSGEISKSRYNSYLSIIEEVRKWQR